MPRKKEVFESMRENTRQKIEAAALSLFARKSLSVTVDEIARSAGLSKGLLYYHYPSKEALIAELIRQATKISGESIKGFLQSSGTAAEKVKQITFIMCEMLKTKHTGIENFMFMIQVGMSSLSMPNLSLYSEALPDPVKSFSQIVTKGQAEGSAVNGDPYQLAVTYWAAIQGLCCYAITGMYFTPDPEMLNRIILKGEFL